MMKSLLLALVLASAAVAAPHAAVSSSAAAPSTPPASPSAPASSTASPPSTPSAPSTPAEPPVPGATVVSCSVDGGSGTCRSAADGCPGGVFHPGSHTPFPCPGAADVQCCVTLQNPAPPAGPALPGLDDTKSAHARAIIQQVVNENLGKQGCLAALATGLTESNLLVYASSVVPESLNYPHDAVGSDHDSIGIFQQRASIYTDIAADMDPAGSAAQFFIGMQAIDGWQTMDVGQLCQAVQRSAYPDRYNDNLPAAQAICAADGFP